MGGRVKALEQISSCPHRVSTSAFIPNIVTNFVANISSDQPCKQTWAYVFVWLGLGFVRVQVKCKCVLVKEDSCSNLVATQPMTPEF